MDVLQQMKKNLRQFSPREQNLLATDSKFMDSALLYKIEIIDQNDNKGDDLIVLKKLFQSNDF